ncbi:hypothetical protein HOS70_gp05 [Erwinia phage vB_EamP-S2]|uniref:Uncharacterized protein n=1 Tax=Erwinia phage vB_EamP-S2 TaxID=2070198 RepID=A0A2K9V4W0_9CAUD|nr:hypothetical protein HOS70_gp05 [Erwinia phage vB_EamP-S2]AUV57204.1 hypothetical protein [Erwinia phage vB_EamP-S2]
MMTLKEYKKTLRYAVGYSASLATLKRIARNSKVKHLPARSKLRIAKRARSQDKMIAFAHRYSAASTPRTSRQVYDGFIQQAADFSNIELKILASHTDINDSYLLID